MDIVDKLEEYRLEHRITQPELAKQVGVAYATINRWLTRKFNPSKIQTYHLEKFLNKKMKKKGGK